MRSLTDGGRFALLRLCLASGAVAWLGPLLRAVCRTAMWWCAASAKRGTACRTGATTAGAGCGWSAPLVSPPLSSALAVFRAVLMADFKPIASRSTSPRAAPDCTRVSSAIASSRSIASRRISASESCTASRTAAFSAASLPGALDAAGTVGGSTSSTSSLPTSTHSSSSSSSASSGLREHSSATVASSCASLDRTLLNSAGSCGTRVS